MLLTIFFCILFCLFVGDKSLSESKVDDIWQTGVVTLNNDVDKTNSLFRLCQEDRLENIKEILEKSANLIDIDRYDPSNGNTPLLIAAANGHLDVVKFLIAKNANVLKKSNDENGYTILHFYAAQGDIETVDYLLDEAKMDINIKDSHGRTPLLIAAAAENQLDMVVHLYTRCGAEIKVKSKEGLNTLMTAIMNNRVDVVKWLIQHHKFDEKEKEEACRYDNKNRPLMAMVLSKWKDGSYKVLMKISEVDTTRYITDAMWAISVVRKYNEEHALWYWKGESMLKRIPSSWILYIKGSRLEKKGKYEFIQFQNR